MNFEKIDSSNGRVDPGYGYFSCPECKSEFYAGGRAIRTPGCKYSGYASVTYHYTDSEIASWEEGVRKQGFCYSHPLAPAELSKFLLKAAIAEGQFSPEEIRQISTDYINKVDSQYLEPILKKLDSFLAGLG